MSMKELYDKAVEENIRLRGELITAKRDAAYELARKWPTTSVFHSRLKELGDKFMKDGKL